MAIARCEKCGRPTAATPPSYASDPHVPWGHPNKSGLVCGTKGCEGAALVWLKLDEESAYAMGRRVFDIRTNSAKIRLPWFPF